MRGISFLLRNLRRVTAAVCFVLLVGVFVDFGMAIPVLAAWLAKVQFLPAVLSFSIAVIIVWLLATIVFGRIYCSTVCPLGVFQDICSRLPRLGRVKARWHYHYSPARNGLRYSILAIVAVSIVFGVSALTSLLDPYSVFGRFSAYVLRPLWGGILNIVAEIDGSPQLKIMSASLFGFLLSGLMMLIVAIISFRTGRMVCNTVCPVGSTLGLISRYSLFHIDINTDRCIQCRQCEHRCKASCIDLVSHVVDTSRCVVCFDCLSDCPNDAISYTSRRHQLAIPMMQRVKPLAGTPAGMSDGRRRFLSLSALLASSSILSKAAKVSDEIDNLAAGVQPAASLAVTPPGAKTRRRFLDRCTGCGLCISHCPQKVLRPSLDEYGILRALHPVMDYDSSWCVYNCTRCSNLCPTGALHPLTISEKHRSRVGYARTDRRSCISWAKGVSCGACSRRCPTSAISMMTIEDGMGPFPVVDRDRCIGCGACQYVCPAGPKAIVVTGLT